MRQRATGQNFPRTAEPDWNRSIPTGLTGQNGAGAWHLESSRLIAVASWRQFPVSLERVSCRAPRIVGAFAGGHIKNTRTANRQYLGGLVWGISSALHEETEIDPRNARYVNDNIAEYLIPVNADIQDVEIIMVPEVDTEVNPAGIKGIGELANVGTAAAVANAVYNATGIRIRKLPIRIEKLLA
jgi:CO/xanthine dehydrogenase Mo-binding subunit